MKRDVRGLVEGIEYKFLEDGSVDWRKMIPSEFLVPNEDAFLKHDKPVPESIEGLKDNELLILLGGSQYLADLRGYSEIRFPVVNSSPEHCTATCEIKWIPNFETLNEVRICSGCADATPYNTKSFAKYVLAAMASNRAFVRAVRWFLKIPILAYDEMGASKNEKEANQKDKSKGVDFKQILESLMKKKKVSFDIIKEKLVKEGKEEVLDYKSIDDLPSKLIFSLIERLNKKKDPK